ncbi:MAG TPA: SusC/RagA family TonB-linked outer membrane protein [Flavitalea sp.]|nr:SusC/RagA family TonB-linked outer membrane protein [Flavitalea sp.]
MIPILRSRATTVIKPVKSRAWLITRLIILFSFTFSFEANANGSFQEISISQKRASLSQIFKEIEQQTGLLFFYDKALIEAKEPVQLKIRRFGSLNEALATILKDQRLSYSIIRNTVVIYASEPPKIFPLDADPLRSISAIAAPPIVVRGKVTSNSGEALVGVSVLIKGTNIGTTTDQSGNYTLTVPDGDAILVFTNVGFLTREIAVERKTELNVALEADQQKLGEVVVTAFGIKRRSKALTYAVQSINADKVNEAKSTNMITSLQGKVAGMRITMSPNGPGSSANVIIRGQRSLSGNNQPLYIIDGVPLDNTTRINAAAGSTGTYGGRDGGDGIGMLNSDDVESITVLKGASAAALYGSQGQNGAIIITTKRGKSGKVSVNYTGNVSFDSPNILPELQYEYGQGAGGVYNANAENSWGPKATGQMETLWNGHTIPLVGQKDRLKDFFRKALTVNNTLSITGGSELMQTYFSYGNTNAQGILPNQDLNRHNFDLKIDNKISSKLSFATKLTYIREDMDNKHSTDSHIDAYSRILKAPVTIPLSEMKEYEYFDDLGNRKQSFWRPGSVFNSNPYWALNRHLFFEQKDRIIGLLSAKYKFTNWLDLQIRGSIDRTINKTDDRIYEDSYHWTGVGALYGLRYLKSTGMNVDALLSFRHNFSDKLELNGNVGASIQESKYEAQEFNARGLIKKDFFFMQNAANTNGENSFGRSPQIQSVYGIATLSYDNYLFFDVTVRNDWSSALTAGNQSYFYPSFGLSAIVSDMMQLPSWISYGKVRTALANSGYGGRQYLDRNYFTVSAGGVISPSQIRATDDYKPELTTSYELGLDWRFFNDRLGVDATYYLSNTKNQLIALATPSVASLYGQEYINAGLIRNNGVELMISGRPIVSKDFSWEVSVNFADNNNKVVRLNEGSTNRLIGGSIGDMWLRGWRLDSLGRKLVDADGRPLFSTGENYVGNSNPDYMMGLSNSFSYKNLSFSFLIDYSQGGVVNALIQSILDVGGHSKRTLEGRETGLILDAYTADGKANIKSITPESYWSNLNGVGYVYSATNMRLRELLLGYSLSPRLLSKTAKFLNAAKISLVGRNLLFFYNKAPIDPESFQNYALPTTRTIGVNLKLSF